MRKVLSWCEVHEPVTDTLSDMCSVLPWQWTYYNNLTGGASFKVSSYWSQLDVDSTFYFGFVDLLKKPPLERTISSKAFCQVLSPLIQPGNHLASFLENMSLSLLQRAMILIFLFCKLRLLTIPCWCVKGRRSQVNTRYLSIWAAGIWSMEGVEYRYFRRPQWQFILSPLLHVYLDPCQRLC